MISSFPFGAMSYEAVEKQKKEKEETLKLLKEIQAMLQLQKKDANEINIELRSKTNAKHTDTFEESLATSTAREVYDCLKEIWEFEVKLLNCKSNIQQQRFEKEKKMNTEFIRSLQTFLHEEKV